MWTIRKLKVAIGDDEGAGKAARYALEPADSPLAFSPEGGEGAGPEPAAYWLGSEGALAQLGLRPGQAVSQADLELALQGRSTDGTQVRRPGLISQQLRDQAGKPLRDAEGKLVLKKRLGIASYDFTFSAPKSVSVIWSMADEKLKRRIERIMLEAWNLAAEHMIRSHDVVMWGREGGERVYGPASGFAAAASLHATARRAKGDPAPAPQLHVHGMMVGVARPDGKLAGINSKAIFGDAALEAGAYGRAHVAERFAEMGFEVEAGTGRDGFYFEIKGVHPGLIKAMSPRSGEVEAEAARVEDEQEEELSPYQRSLLAMVTRMKKGGGVSAEVARSWWRALAEEFEFGPETIAGMIGEPGYRIDPGTAIEELAEAVERCMRKRGPTVTRAAARAIVLAAAPGRMGVAEAERQIEALQAGGALLALEEGRVTSPSIRAEELAVVGTLRRVAQRERVPLSAEAIAAGERYASEKLGEGRELDKEDQVRAIAELSQGAGWSILTGRAGTGKTPVLQALAGAYRHEGWEVVACAIDWGTAGELADDIDASPLSIRQLIERARDGRMVIGERTLILIEEAGKVGLPQWRELAALVDRTGARVLAVGHAGQIGAVELAGMFEEMVRHRDVVAVSELREIRRHRRVGPDGRTEEIEWMRKLQEAIDDGNGTEAVRILRENKAITLYATDAEAREGVVDRWFAAHGRWGGKGAKMIVHGSNEDVDALNTLAQERRLRAEEISGPSVTSPDRDLRFYVEDRVVLRRAAYYFDPDADGTRERQVENGTHGIVRAVDPEGKRIWVEVSEPGHDPRRVEIDLARPPREREPGQENFGEPSWRLDYAIHPNPSQGMSITSVNHLGGHWSQDQESSYVALSRQIEDLHDHVSCEGFRGETEEEWFGELARILSAARRREASVRFRETPDWEIAADLAAGRTLPELEQKQRPLRRDHSLEERFDPLAAHRSVLGKDRAAYLERRAERYVAAVAKMDVTRLRSEREAARAAFASLDRQGALRTLASQRDQRAAAQEAARLERHAASLSRMGKGLRKREQREEREAFREQWLTQLRLAKENLQRRDALRSEELELKRDGIHLDQWMKDSGEEAARYLATERELFVRNRAGMEAEIEATLREPPADIVAEVGSLPGLEDPALEEWEVLVVELETNRLIAEGDLPAAEPSAAEVRDLERRSRELRERRELELEPEAVRPPHREVG